MLIATKVETSRRFCEGCGSARQVDKLKVELPDSERHLEMELCMSCQFTLAAKMGRPR